MVDAQLDQASRGPLWLREPEIAGYVEQAIIRGAELGHYIEQLTYLLFLKMAHEQMSSSPGFLRGAICILRQPGRTSG